MNRKVNLFIVIVYIPKATVQAALAAIALSMGVVSGDLIFSLVVLSIGFSAPFGSIVINMMGPSY